jgi:hypothetical protein
MISPRFARCALALAAAATLGGAPAAFAQPYDRDQAYSQDQADYQARQAQYQHDRDEYERRYGEGSYDRYYRDHPGYAGREDCHDRKANSATAGTLLGGIAGAVIGSNLASGGGRTGGAVIGGVAGAAIGNNVARNSTDCH